MVRVNYDIIEVKDDDPEIYKLNPWVAFTNNQIYKKNNAIFGITTGQQGKGKSYGALSFAYQLDPDFNLNEDWFFKAGKLFRAIQKYYDKNGPRKKAKKWFYDEAGIDLNNLNYFDEINKGFNRFFQTQRHRNPVFMATVPHLSLISAGNRKLMNARWYAEGWNSDNQTIIKPRVMQYNEDFDKTYYKRLLVKINCRLVPCNYILLPKPKAKILNEYEKLKDEFSTDLMAETADTIERFEEKKREKQQSLNMLPKVQEQVLSLLKKGFNVKDIADNQEITPKVVYDHLKALRNKGIAIVPNRDENRKVIRYTVVDQRDSKNIDKINEIMAEVDGPPNIA